MINLEKLHFSQKWFLTVASILAMHYFLDIVFGRLNVQNNPQALTIAALLLVALIVSIWSQTLTFRYGASIAIILLVAIFVLEIAMLPLGEEELGEIDFVFGMIYFCILASSIAWLVYDLLKNKT